MKTSLLLGRLLVPAVVPAAIPPDTTAIAAPSVAAGGSGSGPARVPGAAPAT